MPINNRGQGFPTPRWTRSCSFDTVGGRLSVFVTTEYLCPSLRSSSIWLLATAHMDS
jgi:hypothetical protein